MKLFWKTLLGKTHTQMRRIIAATDRIFRCRRQKYCLRRTAQNSGGIGVGVAVLNRKTAISLKMDKIGPRWPIGSRTRAFDWCQNQRPWMTLEGHYAHCFKTHSSFGIGANQFLAINGLCGYSRGLLGDDDGASNDGWVIENVDFQGFWTLRHLGNEANIII